MLYYALINFFLSSSIVFIVWYTARFRTGILHFLGLILYAPGFYILFLTTGPNYAMHFATENTFRFVSFIFYSLLIGLIQIIIYKRRKKKTRITKINETKKSVK
jgi:membrane-bound ClpP family serine protease